MFAADDVDKRGDFAIQFVDELQRGEESVELLSVLLVVEERVDDVCEVVIDEHLSEVEYQGFNHWGGSVWLFCKQPSLAADDNKWAIKGYFGCASLQSISTAERPSWLDETLLVGACQRLLPR